MNAKIAASAFVTSVTSFTYHGGGKRRGGSVMRSGANGVVDRAHNVKTSSLNARQGLFIEGWHSGAHVTTIATENEMNDSGTIRKRSHSGYGVAARAA